jgi:hypothetical protein
VSLFSLPLGGLCGARPVAGMTSTILLVAHLPAVAAAVAAAAITYVWEAVRGRFARLLGRGDEP